MTLEEKITILEADNARLRRENQRLIQGRAACRAALKELRQVLHEARQLKQKGQDGYREILKIRHDWEALASGKGGSL